VKAQIQLIKAFTSDPELGNPAGVVHDASSLSDEQMQAIAKTLGFSESAFVQSSNKADFRVRFFATKDEVGFCGHATVAACYSLVRAGLLSFGQNDSISVTQETKAGIFSVTCYCDGKIMMNQGRPQFGDIETNRPLLAGLLGINQDEIGELPAQIVATVGPKLMIPIVSGEALRRIDPNLSQIAEYTKNGHVRGIYAFSVNSGTDSDITARFFNPAIGIDEDPATGVAAGPLGAYADKYIFKGTKSNLVIEQGATLGMSSTLYVEVAGEIKVGGYAASFGETEIEV
jgi:PhzF family phenazine biosynthesis protein